MLKNKYRYVYEIGASYGNNTDKLLTINSLSIAVIDLCLDTDLCAKYKQNSRIKVYKGPSFDILPILSQKFDCILIDGDHNWYTVYNELKNIEERKLLTKGGTIFLHDVIWPYGRRDMYYRPENIPEAYRHPYAQREPIKGVSELSVSPDPSLCNALFEGGLRNGVLTAIEDFLKIYQERYYFFYLDIKFGLGVLIRKDGIDKTALVLTRWFFRINAYICWLKNGFDHFYCKLER